ncbi:MAG: MqnA/MqnD/SBP family protein [Bacteroidota bacterium]
MSPASPSGPTVAVWPHPAAQALGTLLTEVVGGRAVTVQPWAATASVTDGSADLALVPTLAVLRQPEAFSLAPGAGLVGSASPTKVLGVGVAVGAVETVAFDPRDGQEALLAQLVLREHFDLRPQFVPVEDAGAEAVVTHGAALVAPGTDLEAGSVTFDLGREWVDLTSRPMPWGLVASRRGEMPPEVARAVHDAALAAGDPTGTGEFQLSLAGYGYDGLEALADHLFYTGSIPAIPELPFAPMEEEEDEPDALDRLAQLPPSGDA